MTFKHLVDPPRRHPGGVLFTVDQHAVQRTVFVTDAAIHRLDPQAADDRAILHAVMANLTQLVTLGIEQAVTTSLPELIVIDETIIGRLFAPVEAGPTSV